MRHPQLDYTSPVRFTFRQRLILAIVPPLVSFILKAIGLTCRTVERNRNYFDDAIREHGRIIVGIWHETLGIALWHFRNTGFHTLTSYSFDGELAARVSHWCGLEAIRGSSSRGGAKALGEMQRSVELGITTGFTLDGPKGPRRIAKPGIAILAARTGVPVVNLTLIAQPCFRMKSWDRMMFPKPFSTIYVDFAPPIYVPDETTAEDIEKYRVQIESSLTALHEGVESLARG